MTVTVAPSPICSLRPTHCCHKRRIAFYTAHRTCAPRGRGGRLEKGISAERSGRGTGEREEGEGEGERKVGNENECLAVSFRVRCGCFLLHFL